MLAKIKVIPDRYFAAVFNRAEVRFLFSKDNLTFLSKYDLKLKGPRAWGLTLKSK
jgi:hypothetical protein